MLLVVLLQQAACQAAGGCGGESSPLEPFDSLYAGGVEAYYGGDFAAAARCLERALRSRRELREARLRCRRSCRGQVRLEELGSGPGGELPFWGALLRRAGCLRNCEEARLGAASRHRAAEEVRADFQRRVPYSYLQRAYIQVGTRSIPPSVRPPEHPKRGAHPAAPLLLRAQAWLGPVLCFSCLLGGTGYLFSQGVLVSDFWSSVVPF